MKTEKSVVTLGEGFKLVNPFANKLVKKEGTYVKDIFKNIEKSGCDKTEFAAFIPCKKLKYKGIVFIGVDFYSSDNDSINKKRIAEGIRLAQKHGCTRLSCPKGFLYDSFPDSLQDLYSDLSKVMKELDEKDTKINFIIEYVIKNDVYNYSILFD